jgi:hypothetical protein
LLQHGYIVANIKEITKRQSYQNYLITPKQGNTEDFLLFIAAAEKKV